MKKSAVVTGLLVVLALVGLCAGLFALYLELYVGGERHPATQLPAEVDASSVLHSYRYAQTLVDEWEPGLHLAAVYARYREGDQGELVTTGEAYYVFAGTRQDWLSGLARQLQVHMLDATVVFDCDTRALTTFSTGHTDRRLWSTNLHPDEWGLTEQELLQIAEDNGGREFRLQHPEAEISLRIVGSQVGEEWIETYSADQVSLSILIDLTSGEVRIREQGETWRTVGYIEVQNRP